MTKKSQIFIWLSAAVLLIVLYLIFDSTSLRNKIVPVKEKNQAGLQLENDYIINIKMLFNEYLTLLQTDINLEDLAILKNKILALKVPTKFKELHITLVLALTKMENYLTSKNEQDKAASQQMINQLKADYDVLNP